MKNSTLLGSALILLGIDAIYLSATKSITFDQIVSVQKFAVKMHIPAAIACYILLFFGLYYFILKSRRSVMDAFLLGIVIYGVFELTNHAIFKNWKMHMVFMDTLWGGILLALTTYFTYKLDKIL